MSTTTTSTLSELLFPGLKAIFGDTYNTWEPEYTQFMDIIDSTKAFEDYQELSSFGLVPEKKEGQAVTFDNPIQGFKTTKSNISFGLGFSVSEEMHSDDQYNKINAMPRSLAFSVMQTVENINANVLNNGFDALFPGADGVALFSTAHPLPGSGTFANKSTTDADLSETSIEQALIDIADLVNGRNLKIKVMPQKLIVTPDNHFEAAKLTESTLEPETANNAVNPVKGMFPKGFMISHYITDPDSWYIRTNIEGVFCQKRRFPADLTQDNDFDTLNAKFKTFFRMASGHYDARSIWGSSGS